MQGSLGLSGSLWCVGIHEQIELLDPLLSLLAGHDKQVELLMPNLYIVSGHATITKIIIRHNFIYSGIYQRVGLEKQNLLP